MRRILVPGSGGSGKTTPTLRIAEATGHPVLHLDSHFWRPGWVAAPDVEWRATVAALVERPSWVMDGNYGGTLLARLEAVADTKQVVILGSPREVTTWLRTVAAEGA